MTNKRSTDQTIPAATLADLEWMCGPWQGSLGEQNVKEDWSQPEGGTMSTMVRLLVGDTTAMIELIAIREHNASLILHLRQFTPDLQLVTNQDMNLAEISQQQVAFICPTDTPPQESVASIPRLEYRGLGDNVMEVHVSVTNPQAPATPMVVVATLHQTTLNQA